MDTNRTEPECGSPDEEYRAHGPYVITWATNGGPTLGAVRADTRENAERIRAALPYPVVTVRALAAPVPDVAIVNGYPIATHVPEWLRRAQETPRGLARDLTGYGR